MNTPLEHSPNLKKVTLSNLKSFLLSKGWTTNTNLNLEKNVAFLGPKDNSSNQVHITIPKNETYIDFFQRVHDLVNVLSAMYKSSYDEIIDEINSCYTDIFNARIIDTGLFSNSLSLDEALREINGIKSLLAYGASSVVTPRKHFEAPLSKGNKFVESCRFGHTFHGSFGFSVEIPVIKEHEEQALFELPFERKVCERIARGLKLLEHSLKTENPDSLVYGFDTAFNSKMCDALLNISNQTNKEIELGFKWSKQISLSEDLIGFSSIILDERHYEIASYASEKLKEVEPKETEVRGRVVDLHCLHDPKNEEAKRYIILKHVNADNETCDIKAYLNPSHYKKVCDAHGKGSEVSIKGTLSRNKSGWVLSNIKSVQV